MTFVGRKLSGNYATNYDVILSLLGRLVLVCGWHCA